MNKPHYSQKCSYKNTCCIIVEGTTRHLEHINSVLLRLKFFFSNSEIRLNYSRRLVQYPSTFKQHFRYHFLPEQVDSCHVVYLTEVAL